MSRSGKWLVAAGVLAFLLVVIGNIPASLAANWMPQGVTVASLSGTVWQGEARSVQVAGVEVEKIDWRLHPLALIGGQIAAQVEATNQSDRASAELVLGRDGHIEAQALAAELDAASLAGHGLPAGWSGPLRLRFEHIVLEGGWIAAIRGAVESGTLTGPQKVQPYLGSYRLEFGPDATATPGEVVGHFSDLGGPSEISGTLKLTRDRRAVLSGWVRARPGAPQSVSEDIAKLPQSDPQGRRLFSIESNF